MKKFILIICFVYLLILSNTGEAKTTPVFDGCGTWINYQSYPWFPDLQTKLEKLKINLTGDFWNLNMQYASDICYSASRNQVIINVPYMHVLDKKKLCKNEGGNSKESLCKVTLNIFSYDTKSWKITRAHRDSNTIYEWLSKTSIKNKVQLFIWNDWWLAYQSADIATALSQFWKRVWDYISMDSWYGDAWCGWSYNRRYYYKTNILKAFSSTSWCWNEKTSKMEEITTYFSK